MVTITAVSGHRRARFPQGFVSSLATTVIQIFNVGLIALLVWWDQDRCRKAAVVEAGSP